MPVVPFSELDNLLKYFDEVYKTVACCLAG